MGRIFIESLDKKVRVRKLAKAVYKVLGQKAKFKVELVFQDEEGIQHLNYTTRGKDSITDVLSYPSLDGIKGCVIHPEDCITELEGKYIFLGSIVLCEEKIRSQAVEYGNTYEQEREYLIIHGLLHLFGYDHMIEEEKAVMRVEEEKILAELNLAR